MLVAVGTESGVPCGKRCQEIVGKKVRVSRFGGDFGSTI